MRLRGGLLALATMFTVSLTLGIWFPIKAPEAQESSRDFRYAVRMHSQPFFYSDAELRKALDMARSAGVNTIDCEVVWAALDRGDWGGQPRTYDWGHLDRMVREVEARGMEVNFLITATPDWVHPYLIGTEPEHEDRKWYAPRGEIELRHWSNFVHDLAERYEGRVNHYKVWNEPNHPFFWRPGPDPAEYAALLRAAYSNIARVDPGAEIVFGGLSENDHGYLKRYYAAARTYPEAASNNYFFDVLGVHPYSGNRAPDRYTQDRIFYRNGGQVDGNFLGFRSMKELMDDEGDLGKKLFIGEYGMPTTNSWGQGAVSDERRGLYLKRAYELARAEPYVEGMTWYAFHDPVKVAVPPEWTLLAPDYTPSLTFRAFRQVTGAEPTNVGLDINLSEDGPGMYTVEPQLTNLSKTKVSRWELYADGNLVKQQATVPMRWDAGEAGTEAGQLMLAAYTTDGSVWHSKDATTEPPSVAPTITNINPARGSTVQTRTPTIRAEVRDGDAELQKRDIRLYVDGRSVRSFFYDAGKNLLRYKKNTAAKLGKHSVKIVARHAHGPGATRAWKFRIVE